MESSEQRRIDASRPVVVVGAGIAGLTAARELVRRGLPVLLIERLTEVGGLARCFRYGDFTFDIGPHRFHTYSERALALIREALGGQYVLIDRCSSVYLFGRYHAWPLGISSIFRLPPSVLLRCLADLLRGRRGGKSREVPEGDQSFEDYIVSRYGPTLYDVFFKGYTTKFAHCTPDRLHHSWASQSIHRATIDRRYQQGSLLNVLRIALLPKPKVTKFIYPEGGIDLYPGLVRDAFLQDGGQLVTGVEDLALETGGEGITAVRFRDQRVEPAWLVWTAPPGDLASGLGLELPRLDFLSLLIFNVEVAGLVETPNQWTYFSDANLAISRISFPRNFHPRLVPSGKDGLCVEVTWPGAPPPAKELKRIGEQVVGELEAVGLVDRGRVERVHGEVITGAYPVYRMDYPRQLAAFVHRLSPFANLLCLGRCGTFWYNNMDDSIEAGLDLAQALAGPGPSALCPQREHAGVIWPAGQRDEFRLT
jgi:protoporphyrinogen oxidase